MSKSEDISIFLSHKF